MSLDVNEYELLERTAIAVESIAVSLNELVELLRQPTEPPDVVVDPIDVVELHKLIAKSEAELAQAVAVAVQVDGPKRA